MNIDTVEMLERQYVQEVGVFPFGMDDFKAAGIIYQAFPKHPLLWKPNPNIQIHALWDALRYARVKCANECLGPCIEWAREIINKR